MAIGGPGPGAPSFITNQYKILEPALQNPSEVKSGSPVTIGTGNRQDGIALSPSAVQASAEEVTGKPVKSCIDYSGTAPTPEEGYIWDGSRISVFSKDQYEHLPEDGTERGDPLYEARSMPEGLTYDIPKGPGNSNLNSIENEIVPWINLGTGETGVSEETSIKSQTCNENGEVTSYTLSSSDDSHGYGVTYYEKDGVKHYIHTSFQNSPENGLDSSERKELIIDERPGHEGAYATLIEADWDNSNNEI
jgi:hypothetical protein